MSEAPALIFLHGMESSSQGHKATMLRGLFPQMVIPDFDGPIERRMQQLAPVLAGAPRWLIIGSSFGGLMGALWTCAHQQTVQRLILLAPALHRPAFAANPPEPVDVPVVLYHGTADTVVPLEPVKVLAERTFRNLAFHTVEDDHRLMATVQRIDWPALVHGE